MEQWRPGMTREKIQDELTEKFKRVPRGQLQLLAAHPRQRRGGPLGRQGGQLGQALRQRPEDARGGRPAGRQHPQDGPGDRERRAVPHRRPAQPRDRDRPRGLRPLRGQRRRRRGGRPGGRSAARRSRRWSRGRSSTTSSCGCPPTLRDDPTVIGRIPIDIPAGRDGQPGVPDPARRSWPRSSPHKPGASYIYRENNRRYIPIKFSVRGRDLASAIAEAQRKVDDPKTGAKLPRGLPDRVVGRVRPDAGGQRAG